MIRLRFKPAATAADMSEVIRACDARGYALHPRAEISGVSWWIDTRGGAGIHERGR